MSNDMVVVDFYCWSIQHRITMYFAEWCQQSVSLSPLLVGSIGIVSFEHFSIARERGHGDSCHVATLHCTVFRHSIGHFGLQNGIYNTLMRTMIHHMQIYMPIFLMPKFQLLIHIMIPETDQEGNRLGKDFCKRNRCHIES